MKWVVQSTEGELFEVGKHLVNVTLTMLREKENAESELMKTVTEFQIESEKELELLYAKQEEEISFNDEVMMSLKDHYSELAFLKSTLAEIISLIKEQNFADFIKFQNLRFNM